MLVVKEEGEGGGKFAVMVGLLLGVVGEWRAWRCLRGWVVEVKVVAVWWSCSGRCWWWRIGCWSGVWSKITTAKEKRLTEASQPVKSHIFPLYNGFGLTTHGLTDISHLGTFIMDTDSFILDIKTDDVY